MLYEIRLYTVVPGRIDVAYERFGVHLPTLFARYGIANVGRWTATAGPGGSMFVYMMRYPDLAARERQWNGFYLDKEWYEIRAATQGDEEATERFDLHFLKANASWVPPAGDPARRLGGVHDLIFAEIALGKNALANGFLAETYLPLLQKSGAEIMMVADFVTGPALPKLALMLAWTDAGAREAGWRALRADAGLKETIATQRRSLGRALLGRTDTYLLEPTPFLLPLATLGYSG
jgi:hypothetical protein